MECQYYEFLAIDQPLNAEELAYMRTLYSLFAARLWLLDHASHV